MKAAAVLVAAGLLAAAPALAAGACVPQPDGLHCSDAGETVVLQGFAAPAATPNNQVMVLQKDGQGNTFGMIGGEKLMIIRAQGVSVAKLGNRRLICAEAGPGVTMCR